MTFTNETCAFPAKQVLPLSNSLQITVLTGQLRCLCMVTATWIGSKPPAWQPWKGSVHRLMVAKAAHYHLLSLGRTLARAGMPSYQGHIGNTTNAETTNIGVEDAADDRIVQYIWLSMRQWECIGGWQTH